MLVQGLAWLKAGAIREFLRQQARISAGSVLAQVQAAKVKAQQAADEARRASATFALLGALSLIIGAFIASVAAALGGRQRDD